MVKPEAGWLTEYKKLCRIYADAMVKTVRLEEYSYRLTKALVNHGRTEAESMLLVLLADTYAMGAMRERAGKHDEA